MTRSSPSSRTVRLFGLLLLAGAVIAGTASARPDRRSLVEAGLGLSCETQQPGLPGPHPFTCPIAAPQPLGSRCQCVQPQEYPGVPQPSVGGMVVP